MSKRLILFITSAFVFVVIALAACGGDDNGDKSSTTTTEAKKGGTLTVYSGREEEYVGPLFKRFEKDTGVDLKVRYGDSAELAQTIIEEGKNSPADAFFSQDASALGLLQKEGLLAELDETVLEKVPKKFRSKEGRWIGTSGRARIVAYNREKLTEKDLPDSILGFTDEKWKGRIGWAPPNASFQSFVTALRKTEGEKGAEDWLVGIRENGVQEYPENTPIRDAIASGEIDVGFINHYYVAQAYEEEGDDYPVGIFYPKGGDAGALINVAGIGIVSSTKDVDTAQKLVNYLLSKKTQQYFATEINEYPIAAGVEADPSIVPLDQIEQPEIDLSNLDDLKGTVTLLEKTDVL